MVLSTAALALQDGLDVALLDPGNPQVLTHLCFVGYSCFSLPEC
jgi:hypothetical protein